MQFKLKRIRGKTQKTYKEWRSHCGDYRVCWRNEISGLGSARYYATVCCCRGDGREFWDFAADPETSGQCLHLLLYAEVSPPG